MSYDIDIGRDSFNYTYNLGPLFHKYLPDGLQGLDGKTGREAARILEASFERVAGDAHRKGFAEQYDAPNGWGSTCGALCFLALLMAACRRRSRSRVHVS